VTSIEDTVNKIPEIAKKLLGIASPSTVMITIGQDLMGGLVIGIESGGKNVVETMRAVINDLTEIIKDLTGAMRAMSKTEIPGNINAFKQPFIDVIQVIVDAINEASVLVGEKALKAAVSLADSIDQVIGLIEPALDALAGFVEFPAVGNLHEKAAFLEEAINLFVYYVLRTANFWKDVALDGAMAFSETAQKVIGLIGPAVQALAGFIEFPAVGNLHEKSAFLEEAINLFVYYVWRTAVFWRDVGLDAAALFAETATRVVTIITPAVEALASIGTLGDIDEMTMRHRMAAWETGVNVVVYHIKRVADFWEGVALDSAATFAEVVTKVIGIIAPAIDSLSALGDYEPVEGLSAKIEMMLAQLGEVLANLAIEADGWASQGWDNAKKFADAVQGVVGLIKPAIDALAALGEYTPAQNLSETIGMLMIQLSDLMAEINYVATDWASQGWEAAIKFAEAVTKVVGMIKPSIDALKELAEYETAKGLLAAIQAFSVDLRSLITELVALAAAYVLEAVEAAAKFAAAVTTIVGFIVPAIEAIAKLAKYVAVKGFAKAIGAFRDDLNEMLQALLVMALGWDETSVGLVKDFAAAVQTITGAVSTAIRALVEILGYKGMDARKAMQALEKDLNNVLTALSRITANLSGDLGVGAANEFRIMAEAIALALNTGLNVITGLSSNDAGISAAAALEAFSKAAVQSMKDAVKAVDDGLLLILAAFSNRNSQLYQAAYTAGKAIGNGIMAGMRAAMNVNTGGAGTTVTTNNSNTYNITQTGAAQSPNSLRTTVTALQMAGTA
ncbi:MAG: hypothetical protein WC381_11790, partial [Kiritimatiellia bacterium]